LDKYNKTTYMTGYRCANWGT